MRDAERYARSFLFVPGDRPDRFAKAASSDADAIIIDLEDAVAPESKEAALENAMRWLGDGREAVIRVDAVGMPWHDVEIDALRGTRATIMIPKAQSGDELEGIGRSLTGERIIALVETADGIRRADEVTAAHGVGRVALGNVDLGAELGVDPGSHRALAYARGRLVMASAAADLPAPIEGVTTSVADPDCLSDDLEMARDLGFGGKLCIHPRQVVATNDAFSPTDAETDWAERVLAAACGSGGVVVVDGSMVDAPVVRRAQRFIQLRDGRRR